MKTIKFHTDLEQSKVLSKILPNKSADMHYSLDIDFMKHESVPTVTEEDDHFELFQSDIPCWSLAALLSILHNKTKDIPSLSGGGYKDGKYTSDWCLDYEFENGDYQKTFADNPIDTCYEIILKLHESKIL